MDGCGLTTSIRDIYAIGIKTIVNDLEPSATNAVPTALIRELQPQVSKDLGKGVKDLVLDILASVLGRFGCQDASRNDALVKDLLKDLADAAIRKKAASVLAAVAPSLTKDQLKMVTMSILDRISSPLKGDDVPSLVQCLGRLARTAGRRLEDHADVIMPAFFAQLKEADPEQMLSDSDIELRENCLQALESFVRQCPGSMTAWNERALVVANGYLSYDPNYDYDAQDDAGDEDMDDEYDEDEDDMADEYSDISDDDDSTWKIRRAAVRLISAISAFRHDMLPYIFKTYGPNLVGRFKEREESVRVDVITTFTQLLEHAVEGESGSYAAGGDVDMGASAAHVAWAAAGVSSSSGMEASLAGHMQDSTSGVHVGAKPAVDYGLITPPPATRPAAFLKDLPQMVKDIGNASLKVLNRTKVTETRTRLVLWQLLQKLVLVLGDAVQETHELFFPKLFAALQEKPSQLRFEALLYVRMALDRCSPSTTQPHLKSIVEAAVRGAKDDWYKIVAESLRILGRCAIVLRPAEANGKGLSGGAAAGMFVDGLFQTIMEGLAANDIDQEIKDAAISAVCLLLGHLGEELGKERVEQVLPILLQRLQNEVTRLTTLRGLAFVVLSPIQVDLTSILSSAMAELAALLRQKSRVLKQAVLQLLIAIVSWQAKAVNSEQMEMVMREGSSLLSDADLQLAAKMLQLCVALSENHEAAASLLSREVLESVVVLASSPLLQGDALQNLTRLFTKLATLPGCAMSYDNFMDKLFEPAKTSKAKQAGVERHTLLSLSQCAAALVSAVDVDRQSKTVTKLAGLLGEESVSMKVMALYTISYLGHSVNLFTLKPSILQEAMALFKASQEEDVKIAAASGVGGIVIGSAKEGVPALLAQLRDSSHTYLLLTALKVGRYCFFPLLRASSHVTFFFCSFTRTYSQQAAAWKWIWQATRRRLWMFL